MIDDAKAKRRFCIDHVTGIEKLGSLGWSKKLRQKIRAAIIRKQAYLGEVLTESRFLRRNANVGGQCYVHARTGRSAVHRCDHRLGHDPHLENRLHTRTQQRLQFLRFTAPTAFSDHREVPAGAKSAPRAGNHYYADAVILRDTPQRFIKRRSKFVVQRIQPFGAIQHQDCDAAVLRFQHDRSSLRSLRSVAHGGLRSVTSGLVLFTDASNELRQLSKMPQLLAPARGIRAAGGRQDVHPRAVEQLFLNAKFAFSLGKLFVSQFPVKRHDVWSEFLKLLREDDAALGVVFALQFLDAFRGTLHQVGQPNAEFDHPLVVVIIEGLRHNAALIEHGPELVPAAGIVVAHSDGGLARIAAHDHELHAFAEVVGECSHYASLLCLLILLLTLGVGARFSTWVASPSLASSLANSNG